MMKKLFAIIALACACLSVAAQEDEFRSGVEKLEAKGNELGNLLGHTTVYYNYDLASPTGVSPHGWGLEISGLYLGFKPWNNGCFSVGLLDMTVDFGYAKKGHGFFPNLTNDAVQAYDIEGMGYTDLVSTENRIAFLFPLGYIQSFGSSDWKAAIFAAPGVGWSTYNNEYAIGAIKHEDEFSVKKDNHFRLNLQAFVWYKSLGVGARYCFPVGLKGPGVVSLGLSMSL